MMNQRAKIEAALEQARRGQFDAAITSLRRLAERRDAPADVHGALGYVLAESGRPEPAVHHLRRAVEAMPGNAPTICNLGNLLVRLGQLEEGIETLRRAVAADPRHSPSRVNLLSGLLQRGWFFAAADEARAALEIWRLEPRLVLALAAAYTGGGYADRAAAALREATSRHSTHPQLASTLAFTLNYCADLTDDEVFSAHRAYGEVLHRALGDGPGAAQPAPIEGRRVRIGFLSAEIVAHPVAFFLEPVLTGLHRARYEVFLYYTATKEDEETARLSKLAEHFRHVGDLSLPDVDRALRADRLDLLIETSGHTQFHRLPSLRFRPAPIQASYIGYPNTTGVKEVDLRIVDSITDPPGAEHRATERLLRLDPCFLCYSPPGTRDLPDVATRPHGGPVVFGSFNALAKVNDRVLRAWAAILKGSPDSRLVLKDRAFEEPAAQEDMRRRFTSLGVDASRLDLRAKTPTMREHLAMYHDVDVALDTFPYNGATTTCESLLMGVPVVSMEGRRHAGRVGLSLLTNAGMHDLVARTEEDYVRLALDLAKDAPRRAALRRDLRPRLLASPICDQAGAANRFSAIVEQMLAAKAPAQAAAQS